MKTEILQKDEPLLRQIAMEVPLADIKTPKIQKLIRRMSDILAKEEDGVAIAAPQIGESVRIFVVSGRLLWYLENPDVDPTSHEATRGKEKYPEDLVFINPKIIKLSRKKEWMEEGCLSVRYLYGKMRRSTKALMTAHDQDGKKIERGASGILAQVFQHETDHLDGKLFIDEARDVENMPPEVLKKNK